MKTAAQKLIYRVSFLFLITLCAGQLTAQYTDTTFSKTINVEAKDLIKIMNRSSDVIVKTWDKKKVKVECKVFIYCKNKEDKEKFCAKYDALFSSQLVDYKDGIVKIESVIQSIMQPFLKTVVLFVDSNQEYILKGFRGTMIVYIPKENKVDISSIGHDLSIDDLNVDAKIHVVSGELKMGNCKQLDILLEHGHRSVVGNVERASIKLNSANLEMGNIESDITINAGFSEIRTKNIGNKATIQMNSSSARLCDVKELEMEGNFCRDIFVANVSTLTMELNSASFSAKKIDEIQKCRVSFAKVGIADVETMQIQMANSSSFDIGTVHDLDARSNSFTTFKINTLQGSFRTNSSSGELHIDNVLDSFEKIIVDGQFFTVNISTSSTSNFLFNADLDFPKYKFDNLNAISQKQIQNRLFYEGFKGEKEKAKSTIELNCRSCYVEMK